MENICHWGTAFQLLCELKYVGVDFLHNSLILFLPGQQSQ